MSKRPQLTRREFLIPKPAADLDAMVHIASLLVHATPAACLEVKQRFNALPSVEIHDTEHPTKLALVLEAAADRAIGEIATQLQDMPGVISVSVVAHVVETERSLQKDYLSG